MSSSYPDSFLELKNYTTITGQLRLVFWRAGPGLETHHTRTCLLQIILYS